MIKPEHGIAAIVDVVRIPVAPQFEANAIACVARHLPGINLRQPFPWNGAIPILIPIGFNSPPHKGTRRCDRHGFERTRQLSQSCRAVYNDGRTEEVGSKCQIRQGHLIRTGGANFAAGNPTAPGGHIQSTIRLSVVDDQLANTGRTERDDIGGYSRRVRPKFRTASSQHDRFGLGLDEVQRPSTSLVLYG